MNLTREDKAAFVQAYRSSGLTQEEFCRTHTTGISPRTLRSWARLTRRPEEVVARVKAVVADAIAELTSILAAMETAGTVAPAPDKDVVHVGDDPAADPCHAAEREASHVHGEPVAEPTPPSPAGRLAMPHGFVLIG